MSDASPPLSARERHKQSVRTRILDSLVELLSEGADINHDRVAERAGVARRTVYRYFPDHDALMQPLWERVVHLAGGAAVNFPSSEEELTSTMASIFEAFDRIAGLATIVRSTPQGRAVRLAQKERRRDAYAAVTADAVKDLPPEDRLLATAMLQVLHTTPWLEMRDQWDLDGARIATACRWAVEVLLKDLRARGNKPLAEGPA